MRRRDQFNSEKFDKKNVSIPREPIGVFHQLYGKGDNMLRDIFSSKAILAGFTGLQTFIELLRTDAIYAIVSEKMTIGESV